MHQLLRRGEEALNLPKWVQHLWVFNTQETNVNAHFNEEVLQRYLRMCGYSVNQEMNMASVKIWVDMEKDQSVYEHI